MKLNDWVQELKASYPDLTLPPPSLKELDLEYLEIKPNEFIIAKVPFQDKFTNPKGIFQGGFLSAAVDEVFGPLSYLSMRAPCFSLNLNLTFIKPFKSEDRFCFIKGEILSKTSNFIFMKADIRNQEGKLLAHAETHMTKASS